MNKIIVAIAVAVVISLSACGVNDTLNGPYANYQSGTEEVRCPDGYEANDGECIPQE